LKNAWTTSRQVNFFWVANFNLKFGIKAQTRKLATGCSKHCFEVVDKTDELSSKYCFEVADGS
ncbi:hypothetical protein V2P07_09260, partial [Streptococcus pneumoniae]